MGYFFYPQQCFYCQATYLLVKDLTNLISIQPPVLWLGFILKARTFIKSSFSYLSHLFFHDEKVK